MAVASSTGGLAAEMRKGITTVRKRARGHSKRNLGHLLHELYEGQSRRSYRFRYGLLLFDVLDYRLRGGDLFH